MKPNLLCLQTKVIPSAVKDWKTVISLVQILCTQASQDGGDDQKRSLQCHNSYWEYDN